MPIFSWSREYRARVKIILNVKITRSTEIINDGAQRIELNDVDPIQQPITPPPTYIINHGSVLPGDNGPTHGPQN